ncbi:MAG: hypothetical protein ACOX7R_11425 [Acetivibrionales bacterium]|jgi:hypothetical protein
MKDKIRRNSKKDKKGNPIVAPGFSDERFGEDATKEDMKKGSYTKVTRVFLDENDPS